MFHVYTKAPGEAAWHAASYKNTTTPEAAAQRFVESVEQLRLAEDDHDAAIPPEVSLTDGTLLVVVDMNECDGVAATEEDDHDAPAIWVYSVRTGRTIILDERGKRLRGSEAD